MSLQILFSKYKPFFRDADVAITPRSLALSEMGSEVDVDQSMNSMSAFNDGYKSLNIITNGHVELDTNVDSISDSGTDSFSEQMVRIFETAAES